MSEPLDQLPRAIMGLINANERLQVNLETNVVVLKQALRLLNDGTGVSEALFLLPTSAQRAASEQTISALLAARDELRTAVVVAALDAGLPVDEVTERLEITSEQLRAIAGRSAGD